MISNYLANPTVCSILLSVKMQFLFVLRISPFALLPTPFQLRTEPNSRLCMTNLSRCTLCFDSNTHIFRGANHGTEAAITRSFVHNAVGVHVRPRFLQVSFQGFARLEMRHLSRTSACVVQMPRRQRPTTLSGRQSRPRLATVPIHNTVNRLVRYVTDLFNNVLEGVN